MPFVEPEPSAQLVVMTQGRFKKTLASWMAYMALQGFFLGVAICELVYLHGWVH